jgi:hypothetical protein
MRLLCGYAAARIFYATVTAIQKIAFAAIVDQAHTQTRGHSCADPRPSRRLGRANSVGVSFELRGRFSSERQNPAPVSAPEAGFVHQSSGDHDSNIAQ